MQTLNGSHFCRSGLAFLSWSEMQQTAQRVKSALLLHIQSSGLITVAGKLRKRPSAGKAGRSHLETNFCPQRIATVLSYCSCISAKGNKQDVSATCLYIERLPTVQHCNFVQTVHHWNPPRGDRRPMTSLTER